MWGNGAIAISLDFRALFYYGDYFIVIGGLASVIGINLNIYIAEMYLQISSVSGRWCVRLGFACAIVGSAITSLSFANAFGSTALAQVPPDSQIVPDSTLGADNSIVNSNPNGLDTISGGATRGSNLFHSFDRFSIPDGRAALFNNGADIQNILTRVTGGSVSNIDGILAARGTANLFLLNPNGIIFGENASLRVGGSFIATTASSINFADGTQFSATPGTDAPLLTVSVPLGLQFGAGAGEIVNRANTFGLQVGAGKTLGLIGGNVNLEGGYLTAAGGRIELGAVAAPGIVGINPDPSGFRFSFPIDLALGDISLTNTALVDVRAEDGGSIATNSQNLSLVQGSQMLAGISSGLGSPDSKAGNININATGRIALADESLITNSVESRAIGNSGDLNVTSGTLVLTGGAQLSSNTFGQGNAGNININANNIAFSGVSNQLTSGVLSNVEREANGTGGVINIKADSLSLTNGGQIQALIRDASGTLPGGRGNSGKIIIDVRNSFDISGINGIFPSAVFTSIGSGAEGKGGDLDIKAGSLSLENGARLEASTFGTGDAGNVFVQVDDSLELANSSYIFSNVESGAVGNGGTVDIKANSLSLTGGGQIQALVRETSNTLAGGRGNAGSINIDIRDTFTATGASQNQLFPSGVFNYLGVSAVGKGGDINLKVGSLSLENSAQVQTSTFGTGDAGSINITASDRISLDNGSIFSSVEKRGNGKGGNVTLNARALFLNNGAELNASTFGTGDAGNVFVQVDDSLELANSSTISSGVDTEAVGNGGTLDFKARSLSLTNGSFLNTSTFGQGSAGNITLDINDTVRFEGVGEFAQRVFGSGIYSAVANSGSGRGGDINLKTKFLFLKDGGIINASTLGRGDGGNITLEVGDTISIDGFRTVQTSEQLQTFLSGIFASAGTEAVGNSGTINIKARSLYLSNNGLLNSSNFGQGSAGNIDVNIRTLNLDRGGIFATSTSGNGGDIELRASKSVRLRKGSFVSTSAGGEGQPGNGGNITIDSPLVLAGQGEQEGNNDIFANAFNGKGGTIEINAQSIYVLTRIDGDTLQSFLETNSPTAEDFQRVLNDLRSNNSNDVAAFSVTDPSLSGTISFNTADIDPSRDIVELPTGLVDASSLVAAGCPSGAENRFTVAGRGGLPPAPADKLSSDALLTDWATLQTPETQNRAAVETTPPVATNTIPTPAVETITEATSWQYDRNGAIILTSGDTTSPSHLKETLTSCPSS
ncbi:hypothetical protein C7Y66_00405 [Chroococcidiopsis sp. CCALA 051]|nr:hypothetical protein C7Y66_00405 [Chroococcidiopsis sp. CCALA 051]